jgi:ABC-type methionine transport system ATPase subunit
MLNYPSELLSEPVIFNLGMQYGLVTNICSANINEDRGWVIIEIEGQENDIDDGIAWVSSRGIRVEPLNDDVTEC